MELEKLDIFPFARLPGLSQSVRRCDGFAYQTHLPVPGLPMRIESTECVTFPSGDFLACFRALEDQGGSTDIEFRVTGAAPLTGTTLAEAALAIGLIPAMKSGEPLHVPAPTFPSLLGNLEKFQAIFHCWYPQYHKVSVSADGRREEPVPPLAGGVGLFFSGGADCMYSLITRHQEITHLIFVHGCDIRLDQVEFRALVSARLRETAATFGKILIEVETNLLEFSDRFGHWGYHYHGAGLSAIAHLLGDTIRKIYIASSGNYTEFQPWGSHFLTDALWSSPILEIDYDCPELTRTEKLVHLAGNKTACDHLRVCWENDKERYNCCRCEKCLRTMVVLEICGALDGCQAFPEPIDPGYIGGTLVLPPEEFSFDLWADLRVRAEASGRHQVLANAIRDCLRRNGYAMQVSRFARENQELLESQAWLNLLPKVRNKLLRNLAGHDPEWFDAELAKRAPQARDQVLASLWHHDRRWLKKQISAMERAHRWRKFTRLFRR